MWRHLVAWLRDKIELHLHQAVVQRVQSGQTWPSFLVAGLLLRWVVFEDQENAFPCSVTSLVDTRKQIAYPPHELKCVVTKGAANLSVTSRGNCRPRRSRPSGANDFEAHCEVSVNGAGDRSIARLKRPLIKNLSLHAMHGAVRCWSLSKRSWVDPLSPSLWLFLSKSSSGKSVDLKFLHTLVAKLEYRI